MMAGVIAGLRPAKWPGVRWHPETQGVLQVKTGKVKLAEPAYVRTKLAKEDAALRRAAGVSPTGPREIPVVRWFGSDAVYPHLRG